MQAQEKKVQILMVIHSSPPAVAEEATLLLATIVPYLDAAIISGTATGSSKEPGISTGG